MYTRIYTVLVVTALLGLSECCFSLDMDTNPEKTRFDQYSKVVNSDSSWRVDIFVLDKLQFLNNRKTEEHFKDEEGVEFESRTIGDIIFSPTQHVYVNQGVDPTHRFYEIRDAINDSLLLYLRTYNTSFLFNGQGALYVKATPDGVCTTSGKETSTRKYQLVNGKLKEVGQPIVFWENVTSNISVDLVLYLAPDSTSVPVAKLVKGTQVQVLTHDKHWYLILTPLGLTGWIPDTRSPLSDLYNCG